MESINALGLIKFSMMTTDLSFGFN